MSPFVARTDNELLVPWQLQGERHRFAHQSAYTAHVQPFVYCFSSKLHESWTHAILLFV